MKKQTQESPSVTSSTVNSGSTMLNDARSSVEWNGAVMTFNFIEYRKGEKIEKPEVYAFVNLDMTDLPESIYISCKAAEHGIEQKMRDSLAMNKEDKDKATVQDAVTILEELWLQLKGRPADDDNEAIPASWNKVAKGGKTTVKDLTSQLNSIWNLANDEMRAILVKSGQFTAEGQLVVKK